MINAQIEYLEGERLSISHGLSSNGVSCILQDSKGFIWIGTDNGLNRYDGYTFKIFRNDPNDSTSLSDDIVETLYEDRSGKLWVGTHTGLNQFNPYSETFIRYQSDQNNPNSLSDNHVRTIYQNRSGVLWIGVLTSGKKAELNKLILSAPVHLNRQSGSTVHQKATIERYKLLPDSLNTQYNITFIVEDTGGSLWIASMNEGLIKFTPQTNKIEYHRHDPNDPNSIAGNRIRTGTLDNQGFLWLGIWDVGLDRLDPKTGKSVHFVPDPSDSGSLPSNNVRYLCTDPDGIVWASTGTVLSAYDSHMNLVSRFSVSKNPNVNYYASDGTRVIFQDRSRILWLGTGKNGLIKINRRPRTFIHYQHEPSNPKSLYSNDIQSLFQDSSGKIWITAFGNGISWFDPKTEEFRYFRHDPADESSLGHNYVAALCEDQFGYIWMGTWAGISRYNPMSEEFFHFMNFHPDAKEYKSNSIKHIHEDRSGSIWFGTFDGGLYELLPPLSSDIIPYSRSVEASEEFDPTFNSLRRFVVYKHHSNDSTSISDNAIRNIYEDRLGNLLVTTANGMNLLNRQMRTFRNITLEAGLTEDFGQNDKQRFYEDRKGKFWVFSQSLGLCRLDLSESGIERFKIVNHELNNDAFIYYDFFQFSEEVNKSGTDIIWISSKDGLHKFDPQKELFIKHYNQSDGLPGNTAGQIVGDNLGKLWLLSYKGLSVFEEGAPSGEQFFHFKARDDVVNSPYSNHLKGANGDIYWGGANGLYRFFPENLKSNPHIPPIVLASFSIHNKDVELDTAITYINKLSLAHHQNSFSIRFAALDYTRPHLNQYAYFLEGFDKDWIFHGNNNTANYTNIPPGNYNFKVKGTNDGGIWNEEGTSVHIKITPPWWSSNLAYVFYFVLIGLLLYGWRVFDVRRTRLKNELKLKQFETEKLKEVDHLKSLFFANISHEFRTPLTLIIDPLRELISDKFKGNLKHQYSVMLRNSQRLLRLINQILDLSKLESGGMKLQTRRGDVVPFLRGIVNSFASIAETREIDLQFNSSPEEVQLYFDKDKLEKVMINLLSNAFKFTPDRGSICVTTSVFDGDPQLELIQSKSDVSPIYQEGDNLNSYIEIKISDRGLGIDENNLPHIFDRFYQVENSNANEKEGSGIGLALVKELVELHHGEITANSCKNEGTEFIIRLPRGKQHLKVDEILDESFEKEDTPDFSTGIPETMITNVEVIKQGSVGQTKLKDKKQRTRILVVDDNFDVRLYIRQHLEPVYAVDEASNGVEGVESARKIIPDLIISDVMMPELDGYGLCQNLKKDVRTSHIPIVLLTAKAEDRDKIKGLETGADDYLIKPFNSKELFVRVKNLIDLRKKLQEKYHREFLQEPTTITVESMDNDFLQKACNLVEQHISDYEFTVEAFSNDMAMSRVNLHRKIKALTNQSVSQFVRAIRLKRAAQLLRQHSGTITEIAFQAGFSDSSYFTKCFKEQFGRLPKDYMEHPL